MKKLITTLAAAGALALVIALPSSASAASCHRVADGISDSWEVAYHYTLCSTNVARLDLDHDGLTTLNEFRGHTSPRLVDTNHNGVRDPLEDTDGDGVDNLNEQREGTSPGDTDTDDDGVTDGNEDADNDGLDNEGEQQDGTDPVDPDTDNDGVDDGNEDTNGDGVDNATDDQNDDNSGSGSGHGGSDD